MRRHDEDGMTLIEVLVTIIILVTGVLATLGTYVHYSSATRKARQRAVLTSVAQREIESLRPIAFTQLGTSGLPSAQAATEAPLTGAAASETPVTTGVVDPGGTEYTYRGARMRVYRYVTSRPVDCGDLTAKVHGQLAAQFSKTSGELAATVPNLCPPTVSTTKRVTVIAVPIDSSGATAPGVRIATIVQDPSTVTPATVNSAGLALKKVTAAVAGSTPPPSSAPVTQTLSLTDTRCSAGARSTPTDHATRDTAQAGYTCSPSGPAPTLMTLGGIPGATSDPLADFSTDVTRSALNGLAVVRDDRAGSCTQPDRLVYTNGEAATRQYSLHSWASKTATADLETPDSGGRANVTLWASTATAKTGPARLCITLRDFITGQVLGSTSLDLANFPGAPTELSAAFDLDHQTVSSGSRLMLTVRVPSDSGNDVRILYDHPKYASSVALTLKNGKTLT